MPLLARPFDPRNFQRPEFDREVVLEHIEMLHSLASGIETGCLILAGYGQNPETGRDETARVEQFRIGDVTGMVDSVMSFENIPHLNAYAPWAVFRRDLALRRKGTEADITHVLALVADLDGDTGKAGGLPIEAPYVLATSMGNAQAIYPLGRSLSVKDAKPLAVSLATAAGCDYGTKDLSHVWRIPGTLNWPNKKKAERGRSVAPQLVTVATAWDGTLVQPEAFSGLEAPPKPPREPIAGQAVSNIPAELDALVRNGVPQGQRSEQFHHAVGWLKQLGWSLAQIEAKLAAFPDGIASKYNGRLLVEIERCYGKVADAPPVDENAAISRANLAAQARTRAAPDTGPQPPPVPSEGIFGRLIDYGLNAVEAPNEWFAFGVAAAMLSALIGRCWHAKIGPHSTHANLYLAILASSSFGKTSYLNAFLHAATAAEAQRFLGASTIKSAAGLRKMMETRGNTLCTIDEIGGEFGRILNRRAQAHDAEIKTSLLSLFSAASSLWGGAAYGEGETHTVYNPCLSVLGFSTPADFWKRFSEEQVRDGLLPRFLFIEASGDPQFVDEPLYSEPPPALIADIHLLITARAAIQNKSAGNISSVGWGVSPPILSCVANGPGLTEMRREAKRAERQSVIQAERDGEGIKIPFLGRGVEMATKLALLMAVGDNPLAPIITTERFEHAGRIANYLIESTARKIAGDDIFESEFGRQNRQEVERTVALLQKLSKKGGVPLNTIVRKLRNHQKSRDTIEIVDVLAGDGLVVKWEGPDKVKMVNWRR